MGHLLQLCRQHAWYALRFKWVLNNLKHGGNNHWFWRICEQTAMVAVTISTSSLSSALESA
jgi:hypothetical protein